VGVSLSAVLRSLDPITRGWAVVTSAEVIRLGLGFVASLLIARALGPADFGVFAVLAATVAIVGALVDGGLTEAAVLRMSASPADAPERGTAFFWLRIGLAVVAVGLLCVVAQPLAQRVLGLADDGSLVRWALVGIVASACSGALSAVLQASGAFGRMAALTLVNTGLTAVLAGVLTVLGQLTLLSALVVLGLGTSVATFMVGITLLPRGVRQLPPKVDLLRGEARHLVRIGRWLWLASVLAMLAGNLDVLILNHWSTPAVVGAYGLALNLASKVNVVNHSLYTVLLPGVATLRDAAAVRRYLWHGALRSSALALALIGGIVLAEPFVTLVYGAAFAEAVPVLRALLGISILDVLLTPLLLLPLAQGRARLLAEADGVRAATFSSLALMLVPASGAWGAIVARLAARLAGAVFVACRLWRSRAAFQVEHEEAARVAQAG
jgi:O-antigen/teichoic acid export membrane protein